MNIRNFIFTMLTNDIRKEQIINGLEEFNSKAEESILDLQIHVSFINHCNTFIPYMLNESKNTADDIILSLCIDLRNVYFNIPLRTQ